MKNRPLLKIAALFSASLLAIGLCRAEEQPAAKPAPTNFIQILTDDQGWGDLGSYGHKQLKTPNIDRLASEGIKFERCYAAAAVCSPSRAAILTGRTPYRNGVFDWIPDESQYHLRASEKTLPQLLRQHGYQTAHFGKWHLSYYTEKADRAAGPGRYKDFGFGGKGQPTLNEYGYDYWFASGNVARPSHRDPENFFLNGVPAGLLEGYSARIVAGQFATWLKQVRKDGKPFFVTLWFQEPHGPIESDPKLVQKYDDLKDGSLQQYLASVTQIDEAVGVIVEELKKAGVADDTLIWYTSDNGPEGRDGNGSRRKTDSAFDGSRYRGSAGGLRGRKRHTHEGGIRVPGVVWWPNGLKKAGIAPGTVSSEPVIGSDVFPTLLEVAGVPAPEKTVLDGTSIVPLLQGKPLERKSPLYWRNNTQEMRIALMEGDWKILADSKRSSFELYNLRVDRSESTDLSKQEPERFESMKSKLIDYDRGVLAEGPDWWKQSKKFAQDMPEK